MLFRSKSKNPVKVVLQFLLKILKHLFAKKKWAMVLIAIIGYILNQWDSLKQLLEKLGELL